MLLGKKPKSKIESDWALILNHASTDLSRQHAIEELVDLFHLSNDEAMDLMENTPIVLLDQITFEAAEKIRQHFSDAGVDCSVTSDLIQKRKCFRAVWPETPDLSVFFGTSSAETETESDFQTETQPSFYSHEETPKAPSIPVESSAKETSKSYFSETSAAPEKSFSKREEDQLKQLTLELQRENETLKRQVERTEQLVKSKAKSEEEVSRERKQFQAEREKSLEILQNLRNENAALGQKLKVLEHDFEELRQGKYPIREGAAKAEIAELKVQSDHLRSEYTRTQNALRTAQNEAKQFQNEWTQTQKQLSDARTEVEDLKRMLDQSQRTCVQLKEESDHVRTEVEERVRGQLGELDSWKRKASEWSSAYSKLLKENESLRAYQKEIDQMRMQFEERLRDQITEIEEWKRKAGEWSANYSKVLKENEYLRVHQVEELEGLRNRNRELSEQFEQVQKQNRDFTQQLEQQKMIQKRMKATHELSEKEVQLKDLVQKQQYLENEIRQREDEMKKVLGTQEEVEREIVKLKQSQKYILEQTKIKEKPRFLRTKLNNPSVLPPQSFEIEGEEGNEI